GVSSRHRSLRRLACRDPGRGTPWNRGLPAPLPRLGPRGVVSGAWVAGDRLGALRLRRADRRRRRGDAGSLAGADGFRERGGAGQRPGGADRGEGVGALRDRRAPARVARAFGSRLRPVCGGPLTPIDGSVETAQRGVMRSWGGGWGRRRRRSGIFG